ncbi:MAG: type IV pilus secretin PilQ [Betaproteobacteria bacterium]|nr:type IV pilus secretin PilQ [Betaproteobacteria bacterium]
MISIKRACRGLVFAAVGFVALSQAAWGQQNAIESFNVVQMGGQVELRITMKAPMTAPPASFTVTNPARIAFDFPGTANGLGRNSIDVGEGELRSVNIVQSGDRARIVLNLRNLVQYQSAVSGRNLVITLAGAAIAKSSAGAMSRFAEGTADRSHALKDINFRRGQLGEGRIVVDLSDASTGIDIRQQGQTLVVEFLKTTLPDSLRRRLDVLDFATPVQNISTFTQGENVRMVIEPRGLWEHNAYQTETQFVIEVKPIQYDPNKLVQGSKGGYSGEKLSLNFQNVEVRSVLNVIADFTDLNIITSDTVQGALTLRLKDVPWDQALDIILQTRGLDMRKNGSVVWIAPRDELATKEKLALESQAQIIELEPVRTETFQLNYAKADTFAKILTDDKQRILSKRGSAIWDPRTNQMFIQDVPSKLDEIRRLILKVDIPVRQVLIEARIVEANDVFSKNLGARLGYNAAASRTTLGDRSIRTIVGGGLASTGFGNQIASPVPNFFGDSMSVNLPATAVSGFSTPGQFSLILFNQAATRFLNLEISALEQDGKGKIISSPRVLTADNVEALIEQGTEIPYQQSTSSGATSVSFRKAVLAMKVKPQVTPDGNIIMTLDINKDAVGQVLAGGVTIDTKHVKTEVLVENGGTVVIGGIYTQDTSTTRTGVPVLSDLPWFGNLFKNTARRDNKTELLVFITPRMVQDRLGQR